MARVHENSVCGQLRYGRPLCGYQIVSQGTPRLLADTRKAKEALGSPDFGKSIPSPHSLPNLPADSSGRIHRLYRLFNQFLERTPFGKGAGKYVWGYLAIISCFGSAITGLKSLTIPWCNIEEAMSLKVS